jgi:hypothetical protein
MEARSLRSRLGRGHLGENDWATGREGEGRTGNFEQGQRVGVTSSRKLGPCWHEVFAAEDRGQEIESIMGGRIGRGRLDSLDPRIGFPSLGREGPSSAFRLRATRLLGRTGRVYAPWAMSGASRATLPDHVSGFQSAASQVIFFRGRHLNGERRTLKETFSRIVASVYLVEL